MPNERTITLVIPSRPGTDHTFIRSQISQLDITDFKLETIFVFGTMPPLQRNAAIKQCTGEFVFFLDDDLIIPKDLLTKTISYFDHEKVAAVGGPNLTPESDGWFAKLGGEVYASRFGTGRTSVRFYQGKESRDATEKELHGSFICFRGDVIRKYPFPEDIFPNDENELINRVRSAGYKFYYIPDCYVFHKRRDNLKAYLKQVFISGHGRGEQTRREGLKLNWFYFIPACFFLYVLLLPLTWDVWITRLPLLAYMILGLAFGAKIALAYKDFSYLLSVPLFFLSHMTYSLGSLLGLVRTRTYYPNVSSIERVLGAI